MSGFRSYNDHSMTLSLNISLEAEDALRKFAKQAGLTVEAAAALVLERSLASPDLGAISGTVASSFAQSGMSEDEVAALLEREKHEMRSKRRAKAS